MANASDIAVCYCHTTTTVHGTSGNFTGKWGLRCRVRKVSCQLASESVSWIQVRAGGSASILYITSKHKRTEFDCLLPSLIFILKMLYVAMQGANADMYMADSLQPTMRDRKHAAADAPMLILKFPINYSGADLHPHATQRTFCR